MKPIVLIGISQKMLILEKCEKTILFAMKSLNKKLPEKCGKNVLIYVETLTLCISLKLSLI